MKISFCILTLNEEANLPRCLASTVGLADETVVLDSGSTDQTRNVASQFQVRWEEQSWLGYVAQKNKILSLASHDWVFSLDADEELSPSLRAEVMRLKQTPVAEAVSGWSMPRRVFYEGRWIRHGDWYPDRLTRLFRKNRGAFAGGKVHERLLLQGEVLPLRGDLHHYSFRDAKDHWARCEQYARLWAETELEKGRRTNALSPLGHAVHRWLRAYLFRLGFLDGKLGWRIAAYSAAEVHLKYRSLREWQKKDSRSK